MDLQNLLETNHPQETCACATDGVDFEALVSEFANVFGNRFVSLHPNQRDDWQFIYITWRFTSEEIRQFILALQQKLGSKAGEIEQCDLDRTGPRYAKSECIEGLSVIYNVLEECYEEEFISLHGNPRGQGQHLFVTTRMRRGKIQSSLDACRSLK